MPKQLIQKINNNFYLLDFQGEFDFGKTYNLQENNIKITQQISQFTFQLNDLILKGELKPLPNPILIIQKSKNSLEIKKIIKQKIIFHKKPTIDLEITQRKINQFNKQKMEISNEEISNQQSDMEIPTPNEEVPPYLQEAFQYHEDSIMSVAVNPGNKNEILTGGLDDKITITDSSQGNLLFQEKFKETISQVQYSFDGKYFACLCLDNKIYIFQNDKKKLHFIFDQFDDEITYLQFHPKGNFLIASCKDQSMYLINVKSKKIVSSFFGHTSSVSKCQFTPNGKLIASISEDKTMRIWKVNESQEMKIIKTHNFNSFHKSQPIDFDFHKTKEIVCTISNNTYCLSNYMTEKTFFESQDLEQLQSICFSSELEAVQIGSLTGKLLMMDVNKNLSMSSFQLEEGVICIKYWERNKLFVSSTMDGKIVINGSGKYQDFLVQQIQRDYIHDFDFIDDNLIAVGGEDSLLYIYDLRKGFVE